jgi:MFS family permease
MTEVARRLTSLPRHPAIRKADERLRIGRRTFAAGLGACAVWVLIFGITHLDTLPPHEDEVLALFVGRKSFTGMLDTVLDQRGGAPLHFLLAWILVHLGGHLVWLRVLSTCFAAAAVVVGGLLAARLTDRTVGLATALLLGSAWVLLFNAVFGRMYSLFLLTSVLSCLAMLKALETKSRRWFVLWGLASLACVASHPYGVLLLAAEAAYALCRRGRRRPVAVTLVAVAVLGAPFWHADLVLRSRYSVGLGGGGRLGSLDALRNYLRLTLGDFSTGRNGLFTLVLLLAAAGSVVLVLRYRRAALLVGLVAAVPLVFLLLIEAGNRTSPESRHLIFVLPFFALCTALGLVSVLRLVPRLPLLVVGAATVGLMVANVSWAEHRTPFLFTKETAARRTARASAGTWLARTGAPSDVLMGYEPVFERAWVMESTFSQRVVPRADPDLAADALRSFAKPLGRAIWVFDADNVLLGTAPSYRTLPRPRLPAGYESRTFGPYLVVRTTRATTTIAQYLSATRLVTEVVRRLGVVNADIELHTIEVAGSLLAAGQAPSSSAADAPGLVHVLTRRG